jgi:hypothetical protein
LILSVDGNDYEILLNVNEDNLNYFIDLFNRLKYFVFLLKNYGNYKYKISYQEMSEQHFDANKKDLV